MCRAILSSGRPDDEHTARLAALALKGADLDDLVLWDVTRFDGLDQAAA